ncbi:hypothetical protein Q2406_09295 [Klebsiella pneumoniae]|nr:hypothetical protein [Klebsiella pneumoniae]
MATGSTVHEVVEAAQQLADPVSRRKWSACRRFAPAIPRRCWRRSSRGFGDHRRRA